MKKLNQQDNGEDGKQRAHKERISAETKYSLVKDKTELISGTSQSFKRNRHISCSCDR